MKNKAKINLYVHRLKGRLQSVFMTFGLTRQMMITTLTAVIALALPVVQFLYPEENEAAVIPLDKLAYIGAAATALFTLVDLILDYRRMANGTVSFLDRNEKKRIQNSLRLSESEANDGFEIRKFYNGATDEYYIESDRFNRFLRSGNKIGINLIRRRYELPDEVKTLVPSVLEHLFRRPVLIFNSNLTRQASRVDMDLRSVTLQKTDYFSGQCSHEIAYRQFIRPGEIGVSFSGEQMLNSESGELFDLMRSPCSNHLGASTLVVTKDNRIIIGKQAMYSGVNRGRYAPSGSGSSDYADLRKACSFSGCRKKELSFNDLLTYSMVREFCEECNYSQKLAKAKMSTMLIGYVRLLERGGKPDYFGLSYIDDTADRIQKTIKSREIGLTGSIEVLSFENTSDIPDVLDRFLNEHKDGTQISIQLHLLFRWIKEMCEEGTLDSALHTLKERVAAD